MPVNVDAISVGCIVSYRLPACQLPVDQNKLWHGRVLKTIINRPGLLDSVIVELLEEGYKKETEFVLLEQIVAIGDDFLRLKPRASQTQA